MESDRTAWASRKANNKLLEEGRMLKRIADMLEKLNRAQRDAAIKRIADASEKIGVASLAVGMYDGTNAKVIVGILGLAISIIISAWRVKT